MEEREHATSTRRTFLKLVGAAAGALGITQYAEPLAIVPDAPPKRGDWIEDRGDFFVVRVPAFHVFASETLDKPTIFILGYQALLRDVLVRGFANVAVPRGGRVLRCHFDASNMAVGRNRPVLELIGSRATVESCAFFGRNQCNGVKITPTEGPGSQYGVTFMQRGNYLES